VRRLSRKDKISLTVWGLWGLSFALLEIPAARKCVPWNTLSTTAWRLQERHPNSSVVIDGGLGILHHHIVRTASFLAGDGR
jgi:hypothetical protein